MKQLILILWLAAAGHAVPMAWADWWSDNGDSADAQDIDAGARAETDTDADLLRNANGPGEPQDPPQPRVPVLYDGWGFAHPYGMPYGYGPYFGYGDGYIGGPVVAQDPRSR